jgi:Holliday junction resolvasome RuvABC endonuclease subunit
MNVLGLDLSLSATAMVTKDGIRLLNTPASKMNGVERLVYVRDEMLGMIERESITFVAMEGYSGGLKGAALMIPELGGVTKVSLHEAGIPVALVPPMTLKKYATGSGAANKDMMVSHATMRFQRTFKDNNEADGMWLCAAGWQLVGQPIIKMPALNVEALSKIVMPELILG